MVHIAIAFATDERYIPLVVSITSMMENRDVDTFYDIYILIDDSFGKELELSIKKCLDTYRNWCSLTFKNVGHGFQGIPATASHITRPTYYRLILPELLHEDKCIYLDTDTIILSDLRSLFEISLKDAYIAGIWHPGVVLNDWREMICRNAQIASADQYINAGVLVMNLKKMRTDKVTAQFMELIPRNMPTQDQDIINNVCYGKIAFIPLKYNVLTKYSDRNIEDYQGCYSEAELKEAWNAPAIVHYADLEKPWNSGRCVYMDTWWRFFRKTPLYEEQVKDFIDEFIINIIYRTSGYSIVTKKIPCIFDMAFQRKYVIFGAGKRARDVIFYWKQIGIIPEYIIVSDFKGNPSEIDGIKVKCISDQQLKLSDKSIVIAVMEDTQKEIIKNLQKYDYFELFPISDSFLNQER